MSKYGLGKTHENEDIIHVDDSPTGSVSKLNKKLAGSKIATRKHPSPKHSPKVKGKKTSPTPPKKQTSAPNRRNRLMSPQETRRKSLRDPPQKEKKKYPSSNRPLILITKQIQISNQIRVLLQTAMGNSPRSQRLPLDEASQKKTRWWCWQKT